MDKAKIKISLRYKISLVISLLVFFFGAIVIVVVSKLVGDSIVMHKTEAISSLLIEQTHETNRRFDAAKMSTDVAAQLANVVEYLERKNPKVQDEVLLKTLTEFSLGRQLASLYVLNNKGVTMVSTDPTFLGRDFGFRKYVQNALAGKSFSEMAIGSVSKEPGFYFSAPVIDAKGTVIGVIASKLDPAPVFADLETTKLRDFGHVMFVNGDGVVVYSTKPEFMYKSLFTLSSETAAEIISEKRYPGEVVTALDYSPIMDQVIKRDASGVVFTVTDKVDKEEELVGISMVGNYPYFIMSESSKNDVIATVTRISVIVGLIIFGALVLGTIVQLIFLRRVMNPLEKLEKYAAKVSDGNLDEVIDVKSGDELESLAESIQEMVGSIKMLYSGLEEEVKEKTADLSESLAKYEEKNTDLENTKKAIMNVMEDLQVEKDKIADDKNRIETILRSIGDGVFVTDVEGKIILVNQAAEKMTGWSSMEMNGMNYSEVFKFANEDDQENTYPDFVGEAISKGKVGSLLPHTVLVAKDGTKIPVLDSAAPLKDLDGTVFGCVVVIRDNTQERELEKSKDDFLSVASHQLRTPLGSMRWNLEMLLGGDAGNIGTEATEIAKQVYDGNLRMIGLVNDLLDVSRLDQGRVMDVPEDTNLGQVIKEAMAEIEPLTKPKNIKVIVNLDENIPQIRIDKKRFREVIENLLSNAVKYNKRDGEVNVSMRSDDRKIEITIADNGMGIPPKDMSRLFSRFFRAENAVHSETEGSGLGLYVVRKFVEGWGGKIKVESELGKGSKFIILLPNVIKYKEVTA